MRLRKKHQRTLEALFSNPVPATLKWRQIEALFTALGATKEERRGSRVTFKLDGRSAVFHRPHTRKEARRYQVREMREFLEEIGITP